ncbi:MAG: hypothetical protein FWC23_05290 [Chitinispirillia bacterium]|nr:hypothetical protein [Chitinispirillia bacterium]MCL2268583.1 hypothetical protein [Chitinispirillia bacterium]
MPKTFFEHGTIVTAEFLNRIFRHLGGHRHDGKDEDGSANKINLTNAAEVTGQLPAANQGMHRHTGTPGLGATQGKITLSDEVQGILPAENYGPHRHGEGNQGKVRLSTDVDGVLPVYNLPFHSHYTEQMVESDNPAFNGKYASFLKVFTDDVSLTSLITVSIPRLSGVTVNAAGLTRDFFQEGTVPLAFRPTDVVAVPFSVTDASGYLVATATFGLNGTLTFRFSAAVSNVTIPAFSFQFRRSDPA